MALNAVGGGDAEPTPFVPTVGRVARPPLGASLIAGLGVLATPLAGSAAGEAAAELNGVHSNGRVTLASLPTKVKAAIRSNRAPRGSAGDNELDGKLRQCRASVESGRCLIRQHTAHHRARGVLRVREAFYIRRSGAEIRESRPYL